MLDRNFLFIVIGGLVVLSIVLGYALYQERQKTSGLNINIGPAGISVQKK